MLDDFQGPFTIHWKEIGGWEESEVRIFIPGSFPLGSPQAVFLEAGHGFFFFFLLKILI